MEPDYNGEIENLRRTRSLLESVRQSTKKIHVDLLAIKSNNVQISKVSLGTKSELDKL